MLRWSAPLAALLALLPALLWSARTLGHPAHQPNLLVLGAAVAVALRRRRPLGPLRFAPAPLALALAGLLGFWAADRTLDLSLLSASCAIAALYGVFGLYVSPGRWRRARGGALLLLAALPFADQADHYLGFGLRVATANVVADLLAGQGAAPIAAQSILVLERGVADVEAACSGLGSVWAGALLLLGLAFAQRRRIDVTFLVALAVQCALLFAGNVVRITALVTLTHGYQAPALAEIVHQPLGVLAFALAGLAGALVLLRRPAAARRRRRPRWPGRVAPGFAAGAVVAMAALVGLTHERRALAATNPPRLRIEVEGAVRTEALPLSAQERALFERWGAPDATQLRLEAPYPQGDLRGAAVFVPAASWRAHHPPALCLKGAGHQLDAPRPTRIGEVHAVHSTTNRGAHTAVYWFQAEGRTTAALLERIEDGVLGAGQPWVLVTLVVDGSVPADDPRLEDLVHHLHLATARGLAEGSPP